jgi:hypothetical protein
MIIAIALVVVYILYAIMATIYFNEEEKKIRKEIYLLKNERIEIEKEIELQEEIIESLQKRIEVLIERNSKK